MHADGSLIIRDGSVPSHLILMFPRDSMREPSNDAETVAAEEEPSESTLFNIATMTEKTDSGRTVTIPNSEVVTVTQHTLIITDKRPETTFTTAIETPSTLLPTQSRGQTPLPPPQETDGSIDGNRDGSGGGGFSTGVLVGISVGGAALIALVVFLVFWIKRRQKKSRDAHQHAIDEDPGRDHLVEDKFFPSQHVTPHTTGTQGDDPFAPFGGRADQPESEYPVKPPENTFEMDATSAAPVELPDNCIPAPMCELPETAATRPIPVAKAAPASDPNANLTCLGTENGRPQYINHWNQYRAMGAH